jgi:hypothetical protein
MCAPILLVGNKTFIFRTGIRLPRGQEAQAKNPTQNKNCPSAQTDSGLKYGLMISGENL